MDFQNLTETKTDSQEIFNGVVVHLYKDTVTLPNGKSATREVIRHIGAVGVIPITDDGKVIVEQQFQGFLQNIYIHYSGKMICRIKFQGSA